MDCCGVGQAIILLVVAWFLLPSSAEFSLETCQRYANCKRPPSGLSPSQMAPGIFARMGCYCDSECSLWNDCCADVKSTSSRKLSIPSRYWSCVKQTRKDTSLKTYLTVHMVSSCPDGHPYQEKCSRTVSDSYDYRMDIPMVSTSTGEWFQNIYCAACHDHYSDLRSVNVTISCSEEQLQPDQILKPENYVPGTLMWISENANCTLEWRLEDDVKSDLIPLERRCINSVDQCPSTWKNETVAELCANYTYYVMFLTNKTVYKNPHCAACHGLAEKDIDCLNMGLFRGGILVSNPPLRLLMGFSWPDYGSCFSADSQWDALHKQCQSLNRNQNQTCPRIILASGEYRILHNGSLEIIVDDSEFSGTIFPLGEYEKLSDGRVEVCNIFQKGLSNDSDILDDIQKYLTAICLSISIICLILHLIIHALLPKLHNLPGKNLQALSISLLVAHLGFLIGMKPIFTVPYHMCVGIAALIHFSYLAAFCWMNVMSIDIWRTFSATHLGTRLHTHFKYSLYAWGTPAVIMILALLAQYIDVFPNSIRPHFAAVRRAIWSQEKNDTTQNEGEGPLCWFNGRGGMITFMTGPITVILIVNILLFCRTICVLYQKQEPQRYLKKKAKLELSVTSSQYTGAASTTSRKITTGPRDHVRFYLYLKLFIIMGLSWVSGTIAAVSQVPVLWIPFTILNGLQGAFIFIMFDLKRNILIMLWERLLGVDRPVPGFLAYHSTSRHTDSSRTRTTSSTNMRISEISDQGHQPLITNMAENPTRKSFPRQNSRMAETALHQRTTDHVSNNQQEIT